MAGKDITILDRAHPSYDPRKFTLFNYKVLDTIDMIDCALGESYVLNGGMAVQAYIANCVLNSNGNKGDLDQAPGLTRLFRETSDIDIRAKDEVDIRTKIIQSESPLKYMKEKIERPKSNGVMIAYEDVQKHWPRIDVWVGYDELGKRMVDDGKRVQIMYRGRNFNTRLPPLESLIALKLYETGPESRHEKDINVLKSFAKIGMLKVDEEALEDFLELRYKSKDRMDIWKN